MECHVYITCILFHSQLSISCSAHMKLTIRNLQYGDFGNYRCISKNSLGETEGSIRVYGKCICIGSLSAAVATSKHSHTHSRTYTHTHTPAHTISNAISSALCATILPKAFTYVPHQRPQRGNGEGDGEGKGSTTSGPSSSDMCARRAALER